MHFVLIALVGFGILASPILAGAEGSVPAERFSCAKLATVPKDPVKLDREQLLMLATAHDLGECVTQNYAHAIKLYHRYVEEHGAHIVGTRLGYFYHEGLGVEPDHEKARYWFRSQALTSPEDNFAILTETNELAFFGEPAPDIFLQEITRAEQAYSGPPETLMQIYHDLMSGNGVHPDPNLAMKWLFEALKHDFPPAYRERARRALTDDQNFDLYQINLSIAAELNDPEAQVEYGQLFLTGNGVQKWPYYALVWFLRAQINDQDVDQLIQAAEQEIDATDRKLARKNAANFDFKRSR